MDEHDIMDKIRDSDRMRGITLDITLSPFSDKFFQRSAFPLWNPPTGNWRQPKIKKNVALLIIKSYFNPSKFMFLMED